MTDQDQLTHLREKLDFTSGVGNYSLSELDIEVARKELDKAETNCALAKLDVECAVARMTMKNKVTDYELS